MNKRKTSAFFLGLIITSMFSISGCVFQAAPSEDVLVQNGLSLQTALPSFLLSNDNYCYKQTIHQTNGEDWYSYKYVKFYQGNIYDQSTFVVGNNGFLKKDEALSEPQDYSNVSYTIFEKQPTDGYLRFVQNHNEDAQYTSKFVYDNEEENNSLVQNYYKDFSFFILQDFEYFEFSDEQGQDYKVWKLLDSKKTDVTFNTALLKNFGFDTSNVSLGTLDFFFLTVENNQIKAINFAYWGGIYYQNQYYVELRFDYQNYAFNISSLTSNFVPYQG